MSRAEFQLTASPHLVADVTMYASDNGGRAGLAYPGWGCPCMVSRSEPLVGWGAFLLLRTEAPAPGDRRRIGFCFLSGDEAATIMRNAGKFYLWEGRFIGEAEVID
jgi:hypothetical protein